MQKNNVLALNNLAEFKHDLLTETLKQSAEQLLAVAIIAETESFLEHHIEQLSANGQQRFVRNGYLPERKIQTGIGDVNVKVPRVRDRAFEKDGICFSSAIVPKYLRRSGDMDELLPLLYLKGLSTNDFAEALAPLVGPNAKNLSPNVISRLKAKWEAEHDIWSKRDLTHKYYVYWWVDGIYTQARMEAAKDCVLVIMGVDDKGNKELLATSDGYRESKDSWLDLLRALKHRGLTRPPKIAVGDGAMGFWGAMTEEYPDAQHQRCWFHKMGNVLEKLPRAEQARAKKSLQEIWMSSTKKKAYVAFDKFIADYDAKYPKATACLLKDKDKLMTFYDFPAEHWLHLRTTNPIESTFATIRHRTKKAKGCFSRATIMTMIFKLSQSAQKRWNRLRGFEQLGKVIRNVKFVDGIAVDKEKDSTNNRKAA